MTTTQVVTESTGWSGRQDEGLRRFDLGKPFVGLLFDYLIIGGGLSLFVLLALAQGAEAPRAFVQGHLWTLVLLSTSAHFAGSTVRLYTKPGSFRDLPFLTMGLPLLTVIALTVCVVRSAELGSHLQSLYLTWSPYHYSAQAYGLAVMYCYRSGAGWSLGDKRLMRLACLVPFLYVFVGSTGQGLAWLVPGSLLVQPGVAEARSFCSTLLGYSGFVLPIALFLRHQGGHRPRLPVISLLLMLVNQVWLVSIPRYGSVAIGSVALFHGVQYLAILTVFHVRERLRVTDNRWPWWRHAIAFYGGCLILGYFLFQVWPQAYVLLGFTLVESVVLVVAVVNIHHFIVDAFIWKLRKDTNYAIVAGGEVA